MKLERALMRLESLGIQCSPITEISSLNLIKRRKKWEVKTRWKDLICWVRSRARFNLITSTDENICLKKLPIPSSPRHSELATSARGASFIEIESKFVLKWDIFSAIIFQTLDALNRKFSWKFVFSSSSEDALKLKREIPSLQHRCHTTHEILVKSRKMLLTSFKEANRTDVKIKQKMSSQEKRENRKLRFDYRLAESNNLVDFLIIIYVYIRRCREVTFINIHILLPCEMLRIAD